MAQVIFIDLICVQHTVPYVVMSLHCTPSREHTRTHARTPGPAGVLRISHSVHTVITFTIRAVQRRRASCTLDQIKVRTGRTKRPIATVHTHIVTDLFSVYMQTVRTAHLLSIRTSLKKCDNHVRSRGTGFDNRLATKVYIPLDLFVVAPVRLSLDTGARPFLVYSSQSINDSLHNR